MPLRETSVRGDLVAYYDGDESEWPSLSTENSSSNGSSNGLADANGSQESALYRAVTKMATLQYELKQLKKKRTLPSPLLGSASSVSLTRYVTHAESSAILEELETVNTRSKAMVTCYDGNGTTDDFTYLLM